MNARPLLPDAQRTPAAAEAIARFHAATVREVSETVQRDAIVVVGMAQNPFVRKARAALEGSQTPFTYLEYGSYLSEWKRRLAIKLWSGWPTFPQVFVRGTLIGGNKELEAALADGSLRQRLAEGA
jgi:glutaredoxin-related protein